MKDKQILQNLRESLTEALEHARGKVTLKMRDSPMPAPGVAITVQCLRDRLWYIHVLFFFDDNGELSQPRLYC